MIFFYNKNKIDKMAKSMLSIKYIVLCFCIINYFSIRNLDAFYQSKKIIILGSKMSLSGPMSYLINIILGTLKIAFCNM